MIARRAQWKLPMSAGWPFVTPILLFALFGFARLATPARMNEKPHARPTREPPAGAIALASAPDQKTSLALPFEGAWGVVQGMDSDGTHSGYAAYALDFVPAEPVSESAFRKRKRLADHPCYGKPILAPADGRVVWAADGARELPPFRDSRKHEAGNFVILEHAPDEFSEFRHLQRGSVAVKVGDNVRAGQIIGRCGNSGNAVTPHLHFGFLGSYDPIATRPMRFSNYQVMVAQGVWEAGDGEPKKGQIIRPAPAAIRLP
jgi:murein DD-endopeptidase MepM/ murein hydrolase activator NlpD